MTIKGWAIFGIVTACVIVFTAVAFLFVNENMARSKCRWGSHPHLYRRY